MNVSAWSIRNPIASLLLFAVLLAAGLLGFRALKIQSWPDVELPFINVGVTLPNASAGQLETDVVRTLENAIAGIQGVRHQYTRIKDGNALITVEFRLEKPLQQALDDVRDAVARSRSDLPAELREPTISRMEVSATPILTYAVGSSRLDDEALSWFVDDTVARAMQGVRGVGTVSRVGGVTREVKVELDPARLQALNASAADISRQLRQIQQEASGGKSNLGGGEQAVRTVATTRSAEELARLDIVLGDGRHIRLDQVATVTDGAAETRAGALLDGKPVVGFEITRARGAGEVDVADGVRRAIATLQAAHPDVTFTEAFNFVDPVQESYNGSMSLLYEGAVLAIIVVGCFLRDWRATIVAATALPLSVIPTFAFMQMLGFSLNTLTLLSLSVVVGILVDDAIVEIENITRHLALGKTPREAATEAADEIGMAVIATTFTLIAVFLPTAFMGGVPGRFFVQFGWTAALAVFFSLVVARLLTPMMAAYLLAPGSARSGEPGWLAIYVRWVRSCLRHRLLTTLAALVLLVGSLALVGLLPTGFIPPDDLSQTQVTLSLPQGSTYAQTLAAAEAARRIVQRNPHIKHIYTAVGAGNTGSDPFAPADAADVGRATLTINLTPRRDRHGVTKQTIEGQLRQALAELPGARVKVGFGASSEKYLLVLASQDGAALARHARVVERELRGLPGIGAVTSTFAPTRPELIVRPDFARAADLGVTSQAIADTLRVATSGDYEQGLAKLNLAQRQVPIVVKLPASAREDLDLLAHLSVPGARGPVPLGNVASFAMGGGPAQIDRYDRLRDIFIEVELNGRPLGQVEKEALALPSIAHLPPGVIQTSVGDAESMSELFSSFGIAMGTGVLCIFVVLVLLFKDFMQPITILAALVLSIPGAFLALFITHTALSMPSMIGLIMLMGIATKNSILLVEYAIVARRERGMRRRDALLDACRKRARPIVMTTIAMGAGMLPVALGIGVDPSFRAPMAIVVIGGLITSTFLSLLVIPVLFTYVDDGVARMRRFVKREPPPPVSEISAFR